MNSTSVEVVYVCSGGKLLPGKRISLGVALKLMTGSKSVVNLLSRFGHCISNEKVRKTDIGMESFLTSSNSLVPDQIIIQLYTVLVWGNFDVNLETLSGAYPVQHTYRICYQIYHQQYKFLKKSLKPHAKEENKGYYISIEGSS